MSNLRIVLQLLKDHKLFAKFSNSKVCITFVAFLGHIVSTVGIEVDPTKSKAVKIVPRPLSPMDFQIFFVYPGIIGDIFNVSPLLLLH